MEIPACDIYTKKYFERIISESNSLYNIAEKAKSLNKDLTNEVEIKQASNLADRTEKITGPIGLTKRYFEIFGELQDRTKTIFAIFKEIIENKLGSYENDDEKVSQAVKTALMLLTEGVVVAPVDGLPEVKISENLDKSKYVDLYFAGPIRAAGGTAAVFPLILGHYASVLMGLDVYKPTDTEIERYVEENKIYHQITSRQYKAKDDDVRHITRNCPVCVNGEGTEDEEVEVYRNVRGVKTNKVRGGAMLVINEGLGLKSAKLMKFAKSLNLDWSWLSRFIKVQDNAGKREIKPIKGYLEGAAAGRPIFCYPSKFGGFRLRYGKTRTSGLMGTAIHPVTMYLLEEFPAMGSQLKLERPGKGTTLTSCDTIEGPAILTKEGIKYLTKIEDIPKEYIKILSLGDILITIGDFRKSGHPFIPVGFCEEWYEKLFLKKLTDDEKENYKNLDLKNLDVYSAIEISEKFSLPLHPKHIFYYAQLTKDDIAIIKYTLENSNYEFENNKLKDLILNENADLENAFIKAIIPFEKRNDKIILKSNIAFALLKTFGALAKIPLSVDEDPLKILSFLSGFEIKDKGRAFVGARLGRPEAAKPRKMDGSPQGLFPISKLGGATRNINKAADAKGQESKGLLGNTKLSEISIRLFRCENCKEEIPYRHCSKCNSKTEELLFCKNCNKSFLAKDYENKEHICKICAGYLREYYVGNFDFAKVYHTALENLKIFNAPQVVKGIEGLIAEVKEAEPIEKGILRAKNEVYVFKDGTIRADLLDANLSHFMPKELNLTVEQVKKLGYEKDIYNKEIISENQMLRLFPQDVVINSSVGDYFVNVANFVDDLLEKYYGLERFYNCTKKEDLIGHLILGLAPHTSAGVVGRILGFSDAKVMFAHPYYNAAKRRNTDGDQDSMILMLDALINFSTRYLQSKRGGKMDAPLVATLVINPNEIDDEAHEMEIGYDYPLLLYEAAEAITDPYLKEIPVVGNTLNKENQFDSIGFSHDTSQFDLGPKQSRYTKLTDMTKKILLQSFIQDKIEAVDKKGALEIVVSTHLFPDLIGNARAYTRQQFRCTKCNTKFRRLPLYSEGLCPTCKQGNIILTISEGSVRKYLDIAKQLVYGKQLSNYTQERLEILEQEIESVFCKEKTKQKSIGDFF
jgi:DNA polymerase II large subunit